jgi:salicylate synthetase
MLTLLSDFGPVSLGGSLSTTDERLRVEYVTDPAAAMSRLAAEDHFGDHVVYERRVELVYAADPIGAIVLY